ncbi:hypothetical protein BJ875DRAFT_458383 [Amylocarpus encephaloides]|uniref:ATP-dependent DNA helicase n=1 Tax=Amylocarpus encephaloides TaxID=45428 RepID=A0A9P8C6K5_9HELO|nr:hypothetical protein BJ875DRAFT_458383 [Amylocarpus encephaloides]
MDEEDYGDIADEDLIDVFSQRSKPLPPLYHSPQAHPNKRRRVSYGSNGEEITDGENGGSGAEDDENAKSKKKKYRIHIGVEEVPPAKILGATQAEGHPESPPHRIRGPIYMKPRPPKPQAVSANPRRQSTTFDTINMRTQTPPRRDEISKELGNLPLYAFSSPECNQEPITICSPLLRPSQTASMVRQRLAAPLNGLRQTTLYNTRAEVEVSTSQANKVRNFIVDLPPEAATHHVLVNEAIKTWVYPVNLGVIRQYQFTIVKNGLFNNLLVALPTGLGKTFIAATIMLNYFRWTKSAQIVFVAPTKPLVAQQAEACFNIVGIPKSQTTMLTGEQAPILRAEEWAEKRVFFMTPQTLENDLSSGIVDPKNIVLLVVDEAHRATGNYAYVKVVNFLRRFNKSFRILALTATPGSSVEAVQEVINGLEISKVEIRTEGSIDIAQYVHRRNVDQIVLDPSEDIILIKEHFSKALQPLVNQLCSQNAYYNKDPMSLTPFGLIKAKQAWFGSGAGRTASIGLKGMMNGLFTILASLAHGIKLLNFHGIGPFFSSIKDFRQSVEDGNKGGKYRKQIVDNPDFKKMMSMMQGWISRDGFVGHPKLTYLCDTILNHFLDAGEGRLGEDMPPSATRVIVFAEFRDSAEDICRVLNKHGPLIRASVFVGQADSKRSEGMNQAKQLETINNFKQGMLNVIVATSIGEEGLDIGQVDLIVCFDASASPIRMLQRMGRTGRKRQGNIVLLLMRGKEEESFAKAKDNYEQMQKMISCGSRFNFRHDLSVRIIPRDIHPKVDKRLIEIPIENTQGPSLPVPTKRGKKDKKMPAKKFHMPDSVEMGFLNASKLSADGTTVANFGINVKQKEPLAAPLVPLIPVESVLLSHKDTEDLEQRYQNIAGDEGEEVGMPDLTAHPFVQRLLGPFVRIPHGSYTKRCVQLFQTLADSQDIKDRFKKQYRDRAASLDLWEDLIEIEDGPSEETPKTRKLATSSTKKTPRARTPKVRAAKRKTPKDKPAPKQRKTKKTPKRSHIFSDDGNDMEATPGATNRHEISGDDTEGEGDDLARSEEVSEDSDASSGLVDFVVQSSSVGIRRSGGIRSSSPPPARELKQRQRSPRMIISPQDTIDDDDDDLPNIQDLFSSRQQKDSHNPIQVSNSDAKNVQARGRRRRMVVESDSDA